MFAACLQRLLQSGAITIPDIARAWMLADHSIYPYLDTRWPGLDKFCRLLEAADPLAQRELIDYVLRSAPGWVATHVAADLDIDGDGDIDLDDLLEATLTQVEQGAQTARKTHEAARDDKLGPEEADALMRGVDVSIVALVRYKQIVTHLQNQKNRRRRCTVPLVVGGGK